MTNSIFISRDLNSDPIWLNHLRTKFETVHHFSLLQFEKRAVNRFEETDWIFFYSKQGIQFFLEQIEPNFLDNKKLAVMGPGSAQLLKTKTGLQADFVATKDIDSSILSFVELLNHSSVLIPRALHSRKRLENQLDKNQYFSHVVYTNEFQKNIEIPETSHVILTSPRNVEAYLQKNTLSDKSVFCFGQTTLDALNSHKIKAKIINPGQTEF